jgi:dihydroorotase
MAQYDVILRNATIINEGTYFEGDVGIRNQRIERVDKMISSSSGLEYDLTGKWLLPGVIDDQVHFREPGLTHKAEISTESKAALRGGTTTFFEMPNTIPHAVTQKRNEEKYLRAGKVSPVNYSFFIGASNENVEEVLKTPSDLVCGVKIFMGSSTGNMLVDELEVLEELFSRILMLIATHCEDENTVKMNLEEARRKYGDNIPAHLHPIIRSEEACYLSSSQAVGLARKYGTRLHVLHLTTEKELELFESGRDLSKKKITNEVCVHHLTFSDQDYASKGHLIKCNPAIKTASDRRALWNALKGDQIDIIATDHAPHTWEEKSGNYMQAPAGLPLVQHALTLMLNTKHLRPTQVVHKMCHAPADCFRVVDRGYIREGYFADLVVWNPDAPTWKVNKENILYKCGWSPLEGKSFKGDVESVFVNGHLAFHQGKFDLSQKGQRVTFQPINGNG